MSASLAIIAFITLAGAGAAMTRRNLLHSVLLLAFAWAGVSFFYLWAGAQFLAFAQVIVYLGAISMAALFAVLLTRRSRDDVAGPSSARRAAAGVATALVVSAVLLGVLSRSELTTRTGEAPSVTAAQLGRELMGYGAPALLAAGVLLTVALIGAVIIAAGGEEDPS